MRNAPKIGKQLETIFTGAKTDCKKHTGNKAIIAYMALRVEKRINDIYDVRRK